MTGFRQRLEPQCRGPCLTAANEQRTVTIDAVQAPQWPSFIAACERLGVHGSVSVAMWLGGDLAGGFNLYRSDSTRAEPVVAQLSGADPS